MTRPENIHVPVLRWSADSRGLEACALDSEWLCADGLGGYAFGTVAGCNTRKYHGLLVVNLDHYGRTVVLSRLEDELSVGNQQQSLTGYELDGGVLLLPGLEAMRSFRLEGVVPVWEFFAAGVSLERRVVRVHGEPTLAVVYTHKGGPTATLKLRPFPVFRPHDHDPGPGSQLFHVRPHRDGLALELPEQAGELKISLRGAGSCQWNDLPITGAPVFYRTEAARGHSAVEHLTSPGLYEVELASGQSVVFVATVGDWERLAMSPESVLEDAAARAQAVVARSPEELRDGLGARLSLAADAFIIDPPLRRGDSLSVIAGYPWFTDWGRDTMISLEGLTMVTNRLSEAASILRTFQHHVSDGLVPNYFPEGGKRGVYHTADATLWFFHAIERYLRHSKDIKLLEDMWPTLAQIIEHHVMGTRFGIRVDPKDGLLTQGEEGYQLTWMDAKVGDWVVTPRRGKAVELNALWFNALELMSGWAAQLGHTSTPFSAQAARCRVSFNERFFNEQTRCLFDVLDGPEGDDAAIRPNQIFAISLTHPVLAREHWNSVLSVVRRELLTPVGLRTLSPGHPEFRPHYAGDLRSRDAAYHQGTVWPWLLGHYYDAAIKTLGPVEASAHLLHGLEAHLMYGGVGSLSEVFDATAPFHARGCVAQAWSVGEALRVLWEMRHRPA